MTWEEAVERLRSDKNLVHVSEEAYLTKDLRWNVEKFQRSKEFHLNGDLVLIY